MPPTTWTSCSRTSRRPFPIRSPSPPTSRARAGTWLGFAAADYTIGRTTLSAGLRYDYLNVPFQDQLDPSADTSNSFNRLSPRGGVSVDLGQGFSAYASAGAELPGADDPRAGLRRSRPRPVRSHSPWAMIRRSTRWSRLPVKSADAGSAVRSCVTGSLYWTNVQNDIAFIQSDTAIYAGYFANIGETRRQGLELAAQYFLQEWCVAGAELRLDPGHLPDRAQIFSVRSDSAFIGSPLYGPNDVQPGDHMPLVPAYQIKGSGTTPIGRHLQVGVDARYTGPQWFLGDEANETYPLNGYFTMGARVGVTFGPLGGQRGRRQRPEHDSRHLRYLQREPPEWAAGAIPDAPERHHAASDRPGGRRRR